MTEVGAIQPINGTELYYEYHRHYNSSETILLIHGFLSSSFSFRQLVPLLKKKYTVISVDIPPFGKSGKTTTFRYSYNNMAKTVLQLLDFLGIQQTFVIGHSMGGQIALNISHLKPSAIKGAVLLSSSSYLKRMKNSLRYSSYLPFFHHYVKLHLARSGVKENLNRVVHNAKLIDKEMVDGYMQPFLNNDIFKALTRMIRDREGDLPPEILRSIKAPSLLIWGEHDRVVPLDIGKRLQQDLPNSKLIVLKDAGHLVPEEKPEEVYQHIASFIASLERAEV
ncbi:pimeloyl-ACP methyl ester carboxylesterase [Bacillus oleivorans]|uniref:Pimeloyl-ACP methyl ester carboxylesterase n=1 Tax=Bacillus oleivorans TaxID=1448271 RepID=A0A285D5W2_9BACI|nr:alpha/beta hydrolase [Bacillus oleivorans]SNX75200.1 pimeloyl-ACP methyl ester carboxylesterase [Bacillus oleivorans]